MMSTSDPLILFPFWRDLRKYRRRSLRGDLTAALSVALLALPQAMAYAFAADLPPSAGIFAAIFGTIFTAAFGCSPILISGPTNTVAILIQSGTSDILNNFYPSLSGALKDDAALQIVLQISLLIGLFQILGGVLRMGRLTQFASRSVVVGYLTGAAIAIFVTQLFYFFGIPEPSESLPIYQQAWYLITHITRLHPPTAFLGLACLALLVFFQRLSEKIPGAILVIIFSALFVYLLNLSPPSKSGMFDLKPNDKLEKIALLEEFGEVRIDFSQIYGPRLDLKILLKAVPLALAITLLSALEVTSIGRLYAGSYQQHYSDNQEIFGLGVSNFFSAFLGAMPSSGSFSRTALNASLGAVSRFAAIFSGLFLYIIVALSGFLAAKIPLAALSALMLLTAYSMIYFEQIRVFFLSTIIDRVVISVTVISSLLFPLDVAFYIGIATSIALHLKKREP